MSEENTIPNFYILLELDPDKLWDQAKFEQVWREKRIEWSRQGSGVAKKALIAKKNLELLPEIRRVMEDPALREAQAQAARAIQADGKKATLDRFERALVYLNAKEYVEQSELDAFIKEFQPVLAEKEIRDRVSVPMKSSASGDTFSTRPQLEATTAKDISDKLAVIGVPDLYALLGRPPSTSASVLYKAAEELYAEMIHRQPKTAEVTARSDLAGHARNIFKSEEERKRYDETRRQHSLNNLLKDLEESVNRTTEKEVHEKQASTFLEAARKEGWSEEQALAQLKKHARLRKWLIQLPAIEKPQGLRCGNCHEINEVSRNFCLVCGKELMVNCPDCSHKTLTDDAVCGHCGFPVGNRYWVDTLLQQTETTYDLAQIQRLLGEAEELWKPGHPDKRTKEIRQRQEALQQRIKLQQQAVEKLHHLIEQHQFYAARHFLTIHKDIPDFKEYQQTIEQRIVEARSALKQAQLPGISRAEAIELCRRALHICVDYKEARDVLQTIPPLPPNNLQAKVKGTVVNLAWAPSPIEGAVYRIICKKNARPSSAQDGEAVGSTKGLFYDDRTPEIGVPLFYAVFAEVETILSDEGAILTQPILLLQDIKNEDVTVTVKDQQVLLSWKTPSNADAVVIVRKERIPPQSIQDGIRVATCDRSQEQLSDHNVQNECVYYYGFYCQFKNHEGRTITSPGITIRAIPEKPPEFITHMDIEEVQTQNGIEISLRWRQPVKGKVVILKSDRPLAGQEHTVCAETRLSHLGKKLEGHAGQVVAQEVERQVAYYTPVVLFQKMAYIGKSLRYVHVDNVTQLKCQNLGSVIRLKWGWPESCQEVLILFSTQSWPTSDDPATVTCKVTRAEYERLGYYDLRGIANQKHHIVVSAVFVHDGESVPAQGVRIAAHLVEKTSITYEIKKPTLFTKQYVLHITGHPFGALPAMRLVSKHEVLPFHKTDGTLICCIEPAQITDKGLVIKLAKQKFSKGSLAKLFLEDDSLYDIITIYHPQEDKLRLDS